VNQFLSRVSMLMYAQCDTVHT